MSDMPNTPNSEANDAPHGEPGAPDTEDPRLFQVAQEYLRELEQGKRPDRRKWLSRYPELAVALNECLDGLEFMHRAAASVNSGGKLVAAQNLEAGGATPLGDFEIVREIGRGGMGIVYEATQLSLGRRVALKVLPFAAGFDAKYLQRFRQEAQAAAQLHHTNIVPVYAVGCERGTHFYAMQLIEGQSLDFLIRQLRCDSGMDPPEGAAASSRTGRNRASSTIDIAPTEPFGQPVPASGARPTDPLAPRSASHRDETRDALSADFSTQRAGEKAAFFRAAAGLMVQAAEALEYAHQQGVIHRDIKPGNLLIDTRRNLWVADFGLAHFDAHQGLTQTGDMIGTIRYASPEQVAGQRVVLDHRTDIYSLGATFYELLTLRPLFAGPTRQALLHQVLNQDPAPPRSFDRTIPVEFETIVLKAISKSASERYSSAQELADDLRRFLQDEPIRATRPTLVDRSRKWMRRHPSLVAAAVLVMFITLLISAVSNWLISAANTRTRTALAQEQLRALEAERRFAQARQAVDLLIDVSETELADKPPFAALRKRLLESALAYYQDFIARHEQSPASQTELISVQDRVLKILDDLSVLEGAGQLMLLAEADVHLDLALSDVQRSEIKAVLDHFAEQRRAVFLDAPQSAPKDRRAAFLELTRASEVSMRAALTAKQLTRVEQIIRQLQGPGAFAQSDVMARLGLTETQRQLIRQMEFETMMSLGDRPPREGKHGGPGDRGPPPHLAMMPKILEILTAEQQAEWAQLTGPPFRGHLRPPFPGFPPP